MLAAAHGSLRLVQTMLEHGADPTAKNNKGKTVLKWAEGRPEVVKLIQDAAAAKKKAPNANTNTNVNANAGARNDGR
jgi:ankyrin repeat protein